MRKLLAVAGIGVAAALPAHAAEGMQPVTHYLSKQKVTPGFYKGRSLRYLDLGPVKLARGNRVAPIWVVTNGPDGQRNVVDVAPGDRGYTPLWRVTMVTWKAGVTPRMLRSAADVQAARRAGDVTLRRTTTVVNCPVLGFGQRQTLGFFRTKLIQYLDLGPVKLARGNDVEPIWAVTNGTSEQHNVIDVVPGQPDYTPLWRVTKVTWKDGVAPRPLTSSAAVRRAAAAGDVTLTPTAMVVNCPVT
jgi:hypothetical protein